jgi:hypothetical protein
MYHYYQRRKKEYRIEDWRREGRAMEITRLPIGGDSPTFWRAASPIGGVE